MSPAAKLTVSSAVIASLFITACGKKSTEVEIPDAPDAAIQTVISEYSKGNGGILWEAMPASYQSDVTSVVQLSGSKIDSEIYDQSFGLISRLGQVLEKQQAFLLGAEMVQRSEEEMAKLEQALPSVIGMIQTLGSSEIASSASLSNFDGQAFFEGTVSKLTEYGIELSKLAGEETASFKELGAAVVTLVQADANTALLEFSAPGQPVQTEEFVKVEDRWVPSEIASQWTTAVADMKAQLAAITPENMATTKPQIMGAITMMDGVLTQIEAAETQEQFDQSLQGAMMPLMGLLMMSQSMSAPSAPTMSVPTAPSSTPSLPTAP